MIKPLLLASAAAIVFTASAVVPETSVSKAHVGELTTSRVKLPGVESTRKLAPGVALNLEKTGGLKYKTIKAARLEGRVVTPLKGAMKKARRPAQEGSTLAESFEGLPEGADALWLPDGWTRRTANEERPSYEKWQVSGAVPMMLGPSDGEKYAVVSYSADPQDEWIISPVVKVK